MKALVTGTAGFIGSHLASALLERGATVIGVDAFTDYYAREIKTSNVAPLLTNRSFTLVEGSLQTMALEPVLEGVTHIFHLAAQAGVRSSWGEEFQLYTDHNVLATQRVLEAAAKAGTPRLVMASSSSVYGDAAELPLSETTPCRPISPYGVTKLACEHLASLYGRLHGVPVVSLRYFTVYGPRQRPDMAFHRFLAAARAGSPIVVFGDGEQTRDFTFVADAVAATRAAAVSGRPGCVYNVGGGERISLNRVLALIEDVTARRLVVSRDGAQKGDMRDTFADTRAAERDLGFRSSVSLRDGLGREWAWIQELQ